MEKRSQGILSSLQDLFEITACQHMLHILSFIHNCQIYNSKSLEIIAVVFLDLSAPFAVIKLFAVK